KLIYDPIPDSSSTRLVAGIVQAACWTRCGHACVVPIASGEVVAVAPPTQEMHTEVSSQKNVNLFRSVACSVKRRPDDFQVPSSVACRLRSGTYVHLVGSPAFLL